MSAPKPVVAAKSAFGPYLGWFAAAAVWGWPWALWSIHHHPWGWLAGAIVWDVLFMALIVALLLRKARLQRSR